MKTKSTFMSTYVVQINKSSEKEEVAMGSQGRPTEPHNTLKDVPNPVHLFTTFPG